MNIGVVGNPRYADLKSVLDQVSSLARARGFTVFAEPALSQIWPGVPSLDGVPLTFLLTLGGDGTLLRGARMLQGRETPVLGINLGRVGFLTTATRDQVEPALDALVTGSYTVERRLALGASILGEDGVARSQQLALNDVVVHKGGVARVIRMSVVIDGEEIGPYSADGIIVATPTGSTAYSLSAGGPILVPGVESMVITPICAHTLAVRPIVLPSRLSIVIAPIAPWADDLLVSYDGQVGTTLAGGDRVIVRKAPSGVHLVRIGPDGFLTRMRKKLQWGDLSGRERS
ncbi:MAG: NAD(+)/NADH kinase [Gemmatimonadota bacterium]